MSLALSSIVFILLAIFAGALVPLQAGSNAELGRTLGHPLWATLVSLLVSLLIIIPIILALRITLPAVNDLRLLPAWAWFGGIFGVIYLTSALLLLPRLGASNFMIGVIAGQLLISLMMDHYGWLNVPVKPINIGRMLGVVLVLLGVVTVQWFTPKPALLAQASIAELKKC